MVIKLMSLSNILLKFFAKIATKIIFMLLLKLVLSLLYCFLISYMFRMIFLEKWWILSLTFSNFEIIILIGSLILVYSLCKLLGININCMFFSIILTIVKIGFFNWNFGCKSSTLTYILHLQVIIK